MNIVELYPQINSATNIVDLVSQYVSLQKSGKGYKGICPFHNDHSPSFSVSIELNIAKCMVCGEGGGPIKFLSKIKKISSIEAAKELALAAGIEFSDNLKQDDNKLTYQVLTEVSTFYNQVLLSTEIATDCYKYLTNRKITLEEIKKYHLGFAPSGDSFISYFKNKYPEDNFIRKDILAILLNLGLLNKDGTNYFAFFQNRLIIPIFNRYNQVIAFSGRVLDNSSPKYLNTPNSLVFNKSNTLFNLNNLELKPNKDNEIYLLEGFFDCFASNIAGINSVATMGVALSKEHAIALSKITNNITILYDGDNAGYEASIKALDILKPYTTYLNIVLLKDSANKKIDPDSFIRSKGKEKFLEYLNNNKLDYYTFRYQSIINNLNLENNNDVAIALSKIEQAFSGAPQNVITKYEEELTKILGYEVSLKISSQYKKNYQSSNKDSSKDIIPSEKFDRFTKMIMENEKIILNLLLQINGGKKYLNKIINLDRNITMHFSTCGMYMFTLLEGYYSQYDIINYTFFEDSIKAQKEINYNYEKVLKYYNEIKNYNNRFKHLDLEDSTTLDNIFNKYFTFFNETCNLYKNELLPLEEKITLLKNEYKAYATLNDSQLDKYSKELNRLSNIKKELKRKIGI